MLVHAHQRIHCVVAANGTLPYDEDEDDERMRVAIDAQLLTDRPGGVEKAVHRMLSHLSDVFDDELLVYLPEGTDTSKLPPRLTVRVVPVPRRQRFRRVFYTQCSFPKALAAEGVSLLHSPAYVAPLRATVPVVLTVYDTIGIDYPSLCSLWSSVHLGLFLARSIRKAARVIVPTETVKRRVAELAQDDSKIALAPLGVDECLQPALPDEIERVRRKYGLPEEYILYLGNLEPKKNLPLLVEAYKRVILAGARLHLVLGGKRLWGYRGAEDAVDRFAVSRLTHLLGYVPEEDLAGIYSGASVFVFPSAVEGFGLPPLEAMACGTPVVTSATHALVETTGDAALHSPLDARALAETILELLGDAGLRARLRTKGLQRASLFRWRSFAEKVAAVYREVGG